ncbi:hypothetical protein EVAR_78658_1 [Eumeta japonica]|uniref:Uncharacterized protein n=1 Tax=Eumeta variegata TaxID=151549 RepID=A0A4C1U810_EUMVA|nr:hypothetical protein EVAR_78658_1 [Eumeta japonica]
MDIGSIRKRKNQSTPVLAELRALTVRTSRPQESAEQRLPGQLRSLTEYGREVAAFAVTLGPVSESSGGRLYPPSNILFLPKKFQ